MGYQKIIVNGREVIDFSSCVENEYDVIVGKQFYDKYGRELTGKLQYDQYFNNTYTEFYFPNTYETSDDSYEGAFTIAPACQKLLNIPSGFKIKKQYFNMSSDLFGVEWHFNSINDSFFWFNRETYDSSWDWNYAYGGGFQLFENDVNLSATKCVIPDHFDYLPCNMLLGFSFNELVLPKNDMIIAESSFSDTFIRKLIIPEGFTGSFESSGTFQLYGRGTILEIYNLAGIDLSDQIDENTIVHTSLDEPSVYVQIGDFLCTKLEDTDKYYARYWLAQEPGIIRIPSKIGRMAADIFRSMRGGVKEIHITDIKAWLDIDYDSSSASPGNTESHASLPTSYGAPLYLNGELVTELVIPDGTTELKAYSLMGISSIKKLTIPASVTKVGSMVGLYAQFSFVNYLGTLSDWCKIDFSISLLRNGLGYFYLNGQLVTELTIPSDITALKPYVFQGCKSIVKLIIPNNIQTIASTAFQWCYNLEEIYDLSSAINVTNTSLAPNVSHVATSLAEASVIRENNGCLFYNNGSQNFIVVLKDFFYNFDDADDTVIVLPQCPGIPEGYSIHKYFLKGSACTSVDLSQSACNIIDTNAIFECLYLTYLELPATLVSIDSAGIRIGPTKYNHYEYGMVTYKFNSTTPPQIFTNSLCDIARLKTIIIPAGTKNAYASGTNWSRYLDYLAEVEV